MRVRLNLARAVAATRVAVPDWAFWPRLHDERMKGEQIVSEDGEKERKRTSKTNQSVEEPERTGIWEE
jgi:hypothetical protein